jgi:N-acetylglucosaminyldiphosphoundecaprenol N-acetyl-beta-D-mannosaminyltransferase
MPSDTLFLGANEPMPPSCGRVLGTSIALTTYEGALQRVIAMARSGNVSLVAAANTHLIGEAASNRQYAEVLRGFDLVLPDGMPLVWALRIDGHKIRDRVYGPYFMECVLKGSPPELKHCFFGGTPECLEKLQKRALEMNPQIQVVDAISPPFGQWDEATESALIERINATNADFVWVALGGVKQETWLARNRHRFTHGVYLAVGDAFALIAGLRNYAPAWMQRSGLTWLHRLASEPRRLLSRYLRYNSRFVVAYLAERMRRVWS